MDRRVKERLVGASILVVLIVLIVPELLSGPAPAPAGPTLPVSVPEPIRNVTVDLTTAKAPVPEPIAEAPASAAPAASSAESVATPPPVVSPAVEEPVPASLPSAKPPVALETATPTPKSTATAVKAAPSGHSWSVQLGSFASRANADKLVRQLKAQGYTVYVLAGGSGAAARYRVRIGPMADRGSASQAMAKLKASGFASSLVPPAP